MPRDADAPPPAPEPALALWMVEQAAAHGALLHVARSETRLERLRAAAELFGGAAVEVLTLPPWDVLPYDRAAPSAAVVGRRVRALATLARPAERPRLLLTTAEAVMQRVPPPRTWAKAELTLARGEPLDLDALRTALAERGYQADERVDEPGEVALRGETIEVFPAGDAAPVRLALDAEGRIASVQRFDPGTQRSNDALDRIVLHPAVEFPPDPDEVEQAVEALASPGADADADPNEETSNVLPAPPPRLVPVFDYLPDAAVLLDDEVEEAWQTFAEQVEDAFAATGKARRATAGAGVLPRPSRLYVTPAQAGRAVADRMVAAAPDGRAVAAPRRVDTLVELARAAAARGDRVAVSAPSSPERVAATLARRGLAAEAVASGDELAPGRVAVVRSDLAEGLARPGLLVVPVGPLLRGGGGSNGGEAALAQPDEAPRIGDLVVHLAHGVTRLTGLSGVEADGQTEERVALGFAEGAELLVPVSELDQVWRYGGNAEAVALDRMGGDAWRRKRAEIEAEVAETAAGLAAAAAARAARRAPVIEPPPEAGRLARRFAYAPSPDQAAAIDAVFADLAAGRPMNRLVCGDVGFGKTEVALRAMAAAALAGWQVALAAPTCVLARQHLDTVRRRFAGTGLRVEGLRATTDAAGREVLRGLASGDVRVVVGTQGLASERVRFARLGLVVIDEEQRFGEADKARLAGLAGPDGDAVHALAMTATPIPRTLQGALVGLRDVSVIATAPVRRQPTRTFVLPWDPAVTREALLRERRRGGQSFVVVPTVAGMAGMAARLAEAVPELRVVQAHGRMAPEELERAVLGFSGGEGDVLLATNIIEAGLDIPRANLMLVHGADRFGLAQLHQLRGRVGRGQRRGTAYFMTEPGRRLAASTRQRLRTMEALSGLGAGVAISAADLDQRGAGDLFGEAQAGHLRAIGTELYQHLLAGAVARLRGEPPTPPPPELRVGLTGRIPAEYVPEPNLRLALYARMAWLADPAEHAEFGEEMADRFGPPPPELAALLELIGLRCRCARRDVRKLDAGPQGAALTPRDLGGANALAQALGGRIKDERVLVKGAGREARARVAALTGLLRGGAA